MKRKLAALTTAVATAALSLVVPIAGLPSATADEHLPEWPEVNSARLVPIQETGPATERLNLIVMCDGYQAHEVDQCAADVDRNQAVQWSVEPFRSYRHYINVYRLEIASPESGVRCDPDEEGGPDPNKITPLRLVFSGGCVNPLARGTVYNGTGGSGGGPDPGVSPTGAQQRTFYLDTYVEPALGIPSNAQNLQTLAIFNTFTYGGIGGTHATTSGGSPQGPLISLHELGHSLGNMADEYPYSSRDVGPPQRACYSGSEGGAGFHHTLYTSTEQMVADEHKWWRWIGEESEAGGVIGLYEGGRTRPCGIFRPSEHSIMRWIGFHWDQVGREHMVARITGQRNAGQMHLGAFNPEQDGATENLATAATASCSYTSPWESCAAINSGDEPPNSDPSSGRWGTWPEGGDHWIELSWDEPQEISVSDVYWFQDSADGSNSGVKRPAQWSMQYWDGEQFTDVANPSEYGTALDEFNRTTFDAVTTTRLRATVETRADAQGVGALEWQVYAEEPPDNEAPQVSRDQVLWVEPMHPKYHELDVTWRAGGPDGEILATGNARNLELADLDLDPGTVVHVEARDPIGPNGIDWVRNPSTGDSSTDSGYNGPRFVQTRQWIVGTDTVVPTPVGDVDLVTGSTPTHRPVGGDEVVYVRTGHPADRVLDVSWTLNGEPVTGSTDRTLDLAALGLASGTHQLTATVADPAEGGGTETVAWTVDNVLPTAPRTLSEPLTTLAGELEHNVYFDEFDMLLEPEDDRTGYDEELSVVGELRLNEDGWFNYFGFPEEPFGTPFNFSHSGKDVKALTYGNLGTGGLSKATFEQSFTDEDPTGPFVPGFGTHKVEHRAIDPAGNIGEAGDFRATVLPGEQLECTRMISGTHRGNVRVASGVTCLDGATVSGGVTVLAGGSLLATDSTVNGGLRATAAEAVQLFGSTINGDTEIAGTATDVTTAGNTFHGSVVLTGNNQEQANEQFFQFGYEYGPILSGNTVNGELQCTGNSAPARDFEAPNKISGTAGGDCAAL